MLSVIMVYSINIDFICIRDNKRVQILVKKDGWKDGSQNSNYIVDATVLIKTKQNNYIYIYI